MGIQNFDYLTENIDLIPDRELDPRNIIDFFFQCCLHGRIKAAKYLYFCYNNLFNNELRIRCATFVVRHKEPEFLKKLLHGYNTVNFCDYGFSNLFKYEHKENISVVCNKFDSPDKNIKILQYCFKYGTIELIHYLLENGFYLNEEFVHSKLTPCIFSNNNGDQILLYILNLYPDINNDIFCECISNNNIKQMDILYNKSSFFKEKWQEDENFTNNILINIIDKPFSIDIFKYLHEKNAKIFKNGLFKFALSKNNVPILKYYISLEFVPAIDVIQTIFSIKDWDIISPIIDNSNFRYDQIRKFFIHCLNSREFVIAQKLLPNIYKNDSEVIRNIPDSPSYSNLTYHIKRWLQDKGWDIDVPAYTYNPFYSV